MLLTLALMTCCVLIGFGMAVAAFSLLEALFETPDAGTRRRDTRRKAAEALTTLEADANLAHTEVLRNVSQSA